MDGLSDGGAAGAHATIAAYTADAILPALTVFAGALALIDELAELGASVIVLDLVGRQACDDVVAVRQQLADESYGQG